MSTQEQTELSQYVPGFTANLNLAPQQTESKLVGLVESDLSYGTPGEMFNMDDIGETAPEPVQTRVPDTPDKFIGAARRVAIFSEFQDSCWFDNVDKVKEIVDPTSTKMRALMAGLGRYRDAKIMNAMLGNTLIKTDNTDSSISTLALPAAQTIAVNLQTRVHHDETIPGASADYGLSVSKLITAKMILDESELEGERYVLLSSLQIADLLAITPVTSQYYANVKALVEGKVQNILGFNVVTMASKRMLKTGANRRCIAWIKEAVQYRGRTITDASINKRADKSMTPQAFYKASHAAGRRYDTAVVEILCKE